jgi:hypothetical protein
MAAFFGFITLRSLPFGLPSLASLPFRRVALRAKKGLLRKAQRKERRRSKSDGTILFRLLGDAMKQAKRKEEGR